MGFTNLVLSLMNKNLIKFQFTVITLFTLLNLAQAQQPMTPLFNCYTENNKDLSKPDFSLILIKSHEILTDGYYLLGPKPVPVEYFENPSHDKTISVLAFHRTLFISLNISKEHKGNHFKAVFSDTLRDIPLVCVKF
ncbi:MAG: hypothetical protein L6Q37_05010 [Bdellovibrionaceae bacterium]|nr:hypothetical protein [Pseudobdellovibrionaceae bacterium]NUM58018.1 hypothetical protein [Pseudobdellovibrionaceae bacterium]